MSRFTSIQLGLPEDGVTSDSGEGRVHGDRGIDWRYQVFLHPEGEIWAVGINDARQFITLWGGAKTDDERYRFSHAGHLRPVYDGAVEAIIREKSALGYQAVEQGAWAFIQVPGLDRTLMLVPRESGLAFPALAENATPPGIPLDVVIADANQLAVIGVVSISF